MFLFAEIIIFSFEQNGGDRRGTMDKETNNADSSALLMVIANI
jgi:hypothetical protein